MQKSMTRTLSAMLFAVLFVGSVAVAPSLAYAQYEDYGGGNVGYLGGSGVDTGWYDTGSSYTPDTGWYDTGSSYTPDTGWYDTGSSYTPDTGWYDTGSSYTPETGWYDTGSSYTPSTSYGTSYSPSSGSSYGSSATYGSSYIPSYAAQYIPTYAMQYIPSYVTSAPTYSVSSQRTPTYTTTSAPINNTNTNTNVNTPTAVATATNGPITNTNTFAPVINVGNAGPQRPVEYNIPAPSCTIYATNAYSTGYNYNQPITLTWNSQNANRGYISPNVGDVQPQGSRTVYPSGYTTYTLTVYGSGGSATCQTAANYATNYVAPAPIYTAPATPYVSLSQIPYTGFDFGPFGNAMYWAALLAVAGAAAYLLVYFLPGRRNFAFANFTDGKRNDSFDPVKDDESSHGTWNKDLETVFQSNLVPVTTLSPVSAPEVATVASILPTIEASRLTTDSMIVDRSSGAPRIVIARN